MKHIHYSCHCTAPDILERRITGRIYTLQLALNTLADWAHTQGVKSSITPNLTDGSGY